ncbi:MAG TPA: type III secretion protein HrpB4 [Methylibium sp.]|uniref:type III secretion protein HrpB4 n=1 Tax=Methylibium sp. TaxID=2067992 RepID=UPI002DB65D8A|nr:type III secretion protein HrpB4 [Methylibium sp.]HEU4459568.1 type III secretion protein HrpB4 [Methylibium sp.]
MNPAQTARLAEAYLALERRLSGSLASIDPSWRARWFADAELAALLNDAGAAREARVAQSLFTRICGPWPALAALATPAGAWSLLARGELLPRLAAHALLQRPGVLRSCVQRATRQALEAALGAAFEPMWRAAGGGGRAAPASLDVGAPLLWARVGYADIERCGAWPDRSLRRLARLCLPAETPRRELRLALTAGLPLGASLPRSREACEQGIARVEGWLGADAAMAA